MDLMPKIVDRVTGDIVYMRIDKIRMISEVDRSKSKPGQFFLEIYYGDIQSKHTVSFYSVEDGEKVRDELLDSIKIYLTAVTGIPASTLSTQDKVQEPDPDEEIQILTI